MPDESQPVAEPNELSFEETLPDVLGRWWLRPPLILLGMLALGSAFVFADWWSTVPDSLTATYVGRSRCIHCHQDQAEKFVGSHHDLAMDAATDDTVLGNFDDFEFTHHDVISRLFREDEKFMIHTEGPTGEMADFHIKWVFGVDPIQQYMVEFDRDENTAADEVARVQVLRISWDVHSKRWFYLPPPDVAEKLDPTDDLHWTGVAQRWNFMCADCHSTNLQKNFDEQTASYHTTFSEIDVSCEACHGPGSVHIDLADSKSFFWDRKRGFGLARLKDKNAETQIQACAQCHSRRRKVHPEFRPGKPFFDHYATELLSAQTYFCDGQIMDEVYVHGSFLQSKMYHKGIRCTDCHDPHSTKLKFAGNQLCTSCHSHPNSHPAGKFDGPAHHHHKPGSLGASCVECHMPETTYMEMDPRRDHSLRVPRPDLSVDLGLPNACSRCHFEPEKLPEVQREGKRQYIDFVRAAGEDEVIRNELNRLDRWSLDAVRKWYPDSKHIDTDHWARQLKLAWENDSGSGAALRTLTEKKTLPAIIRATGLTQLSFYGDGDENCLAIEPHLVDPAPLVRMAAISVYESIMPNMDMNEIYQDEMLRATADDLRPRIYPILALLDDPSRVVRSEAARVLSRIDYRISNYVLEREDREKMLKGLEELRIGMMENNDRAGAHAVMGNIYSNLGWFEKAEQAYEAAIRVEPAVTGPRTNLAELMDYHMSQLDREARQLAQQRRMEELEELAGKIARYKLRAEKYRADELPNVARDAGLAPNIPPILYRYAMSLYVNGKHDEAAAQLDRALELEPKNPRYLWMQGLLMQKLEQYDKALSLIDRLINEVPDNPQHRQLWRQIHDQREMKAKREQEEDESN